MVSFGSPRKPTLSLKVILAHRISPVLVVRRWQWRRFVGARQAWEIGILVTMGVSFLMQPVFQGMPQGLVNVPFWEYWTSPYSSHYRPYTQWLGDVQWGHLMTHVPEGVEHCSDEEL